MLYSVRWWLSTALVCCLGFMVLAAAQPAVTRPLLFELRFSPQVSDKPFTGRVYVMLSKQPMPTLRSGPAWFNPEPFFALDVKDWKPGEPVQLTAEALGCPSKLDKLTKGTYSLRAVMDFNRGGRSFATADGNGYSKELRRELDPAQSGVVTLQLDQVYRSPDFKEGERLKLVEIESPLLSAFHNQPTKLRAGVVLPRSYLTEPQQRYPAIYEIPGFGGTHTMASIRLASNATDVAGTEMLHVMLDPSCRWGHHVFADSDNNGPCGRALIEELIPHIDRQFRTVAQARGRLVTGHSSGGWSSLWLQVKYPDVFGGVWSTAPDAVDFRDFQRVNIYAAGNNIFTDEAGKQRPLARRGDKILLHYKPFSDMEDVMGHGGQLMAFEAVFGTRGLDGKPRPLWDRKTGTIDSVTAKSWERYDIRLQLERGWAELAPKLQGKLHVYMGSEDTFYLEGATILLKQALARLSSDAVVEIFPGRDHSTLLDQALRTRIAREMAEQYRRTAVK